MTTTSADPGVRGRRDNNGGERPSKEVSAMENNGKNNREGPQGIPTVKKPGKGGKPRIRYQSVMEAVEGLRRPLVLTAVAAALFYAVLMVAGTWWLGKKLASSPRSLSQMEVCLRGMDSIFNNKPARDLMDESTFRDASQIHFETEGIVSVRIESPGACGVIVKEKGGYKDYLVKLEKSGGFPRLYRIKDANARKVLNRPGWRKRK